MYVIVEVDTNGYMKYYIHVYIILENIMSYHHQGFLSFTRFAFPKSLRKKFGRASHMFLYDVHTSSLFSNWLFLMLRWSRMMTILGHRCWLLLLMLIYLLLLFHKFSGLWSTTHSSCRPPQPRRELLTKEEEEGFEGWKEEQMKRRVRVKKFCQKEKGWKETWLNDPNIHPLMFQYNAQHSLTGCLQPKVFQSSQIS